MRFGCHLLAVSCLLLTSCGTPTGRALLKTAHYATLGLVSDPSLSDDARLQAAQDAQDAALIESENARRSDQFKKYHTSAIGLFVVGIVLLVAWRIKAIKAITGIDAMAGLICVAGAGILSFFALYMESNIDRIGTALGIMFSLAAIFALLRFFPFWKPITKH